MVHRKRRRRSPDELLINLGEHPVCFAAPDCGIIYSGGDVGKKTAADNSTTKLAAPTPWPNANARLLGLGAGLPVQPLDRLAQFSPKDFERFTLEWASDYLSSKVVGVYEVQQRGGSGDKGRDVIVWFDPPSAESPQVVALSMQTLRCKARCGDGCCRNR